MGVERLSRKLKRDPDFVEDIMETLEENMFKVISHTLEKLDEHGVQLDFSAWWEDMCFNKGPLLSPKMFEEFMVPKYKRITELRITVSASIRFRWC
ncbi:hypothetical protein AKJ64_02145 [candidate division MSBL1 archaeon SCGC-AAA259E17]|uniref:Uncharacterized protein n=1 Tax=candidate division MSBL1 archaeon SCGC-AAA259E17 TaxID=1698263 RepID=A0A133UF70_9EURY|nr:hypothetical protein AKJ64_02145 [candidate division MSBL1 archaeon SCGC-AAA259E17]